ncbi:JAB-like toxin 1 domain-containing protein [Dysgonomonas sp. 521]|uniref:JAB-like toxin 1 domain-containing protein n=1 Tax=Dysgonomonas sp. 521 TaxID=2302932 RepID=UPI0013D87C0A|nr:JAB-like toxin 1 domain-containing protein [Dysgonomonas sp. 521]
MNDHLGNNRVVANASGTLVQKNHYYPFGSVFASTTGAGKQPYKYNGKELDAMHGVNLYDYSARYMDSQIGRFTSVDPLAEKKYWISPYTYARNNPLRFIDPDGRDEWEINEKGEMINRIENKDKDIIHIVDKDGKRVDGKSSQEYGYGTITMEQITLKPEGSKEWSYDKYTIQGDDNANSIFEFLADNTKVEWSHATFGKEGKEKANFITTTHGEWNEGGMRDVFIKQYMKGIPMIEHSHNHPIHNVYAPYPSGLPGTDSYGSGDISFSSSIVGSSSNISLVIPIFKVYDPKTGKSISYGPNSVKSDFDYFNK